MTTQRTVTEQQRIAAVRAVESGESTTAVAKRMHVSTESIRGWRQKYAGNVRAVRATVQTLSNTELQADNRALRELLGTMVFQAWRGGTLGEDILQTIATMRPQAGIGSVPNIPPHVSSQQSANGTVQLPQ